MSRSLHVFITLSQLAVSTIALSGFLAAAAQAAQAPASPSMGFHLGLTREPAMVLTSDAMVYVANDSAIAYSGDLFRYGQYWFAHDGDHWYRALGYDGEFKAIEKSRVPRAVILVPKRFWKGYTGADAMAPVASRHAPKPSKATGPASSPAVASREPAARSTISVASTRPRVVAVSH